MISFVTSARFVLRPDVHDGSHDRHAYRYESTNRVARGRSRLESRARTGEATIGFDLAGDRARLQGADALAHLLGRLHRTASHAADPDHACQCHRLSAQWTFQTGIIPRRGYEGTPLVVDGVMYLTGPFNTAWAIDARTGRAFWRYRRDLPNDLTYGAVSPVNRGMGLLGNRLFLPTADAHLVALDTASGNVVWDTALADYKIGYAATAAPLVVKDKVIVGISGGDFPTRGFLDAYDPETGKRIWRFYTVPGPGEPGSETWPGTEVMARGGAATWVTGSYDPELNTIYWGTGNP